MNTENELREVTPDFPDIKSRGVTLIVVRGREPMFATSTTDKRDLIKNRKPRDLIMAVWGGQYRNDVFKIDVKRAATELGIQ